MNPERIALLDQLGFSWEVRACLERPRATWQQRLEELSDYHKQHGHFRIPIDGTMPQLHAWCWEQYQKLQTIDQHGTSAAKRMGPERVQALETIGFTKNVELSGQPPVLGAVPVPSVSAASIPPTPPPKVKQEASSSFPCTTTTTPAAKSSSHDNDKAIVLPIGGDTKDDGTKDCFAAPNVKEESKQGEPADDDTHQMPFGTIEI
jgi:hypothetical protein